MRRPSCFFRVGFTVGLLLSFPFATLAQEVDAKMAEITAQFQEAYDRDVNQPHEAAVADLDAKYATALERALDASTSAGNLEESLRLREEQARLTEKKPLPSADPETLPESLKSLRTTYRTALAGLETSKQQKARPLLKALDEQLEALQVELTQAKRIDDALLVQARREDLKTQVIAQKAANPVAAAANAAPRDWLDLARRRGGRLKLWGGPEPGAPIEVPTKAAKYDDYVSLDVCGVIQKYVTLTRRDGSIVIIELANFEVHEPKNVAQNCRGEMATYLGKDGSVYHPNGTELFDPRVVKKPVGFAHGYRCGLVYGEDGEFEVFKMADGFEPPPSDFLKGKTITMAAANNAFVFATADGDVLMWDCQDKRQPDLSRLKDKRVVGLVAQSGHGFLTSDGKLLFCDSEGRFGNGTMPARATLATRNEPQPFVRIRGSAAQRADGIWISWDMKPPLQAKLESLGPVIDLDREGGTERARDLGVLAWIELPPGTKSDVPSGTSTPSPKP